MRFGVLFEVLIQHDYWLNLDAVVFEALPPARQRAVRRRHDTIGYLDAVPTQPAKATLAGHGMLFKKLPSGFIVGVELEGSTSVARRPLAANDVLTFALIARDPKLFNYTAGLLPRFHRFGNASGNENGGQLFLSQPVALHQPARGYRASEVMKRATGPVIDLYQAVADIGPGPFNPAQWQRIPANTYDSALTYQQGTVVLESNTLLRALVDSPGTDLTNAAEWSVEGTLANEYVTGADEILLRPQVFDVDVASAGATSLTLRVTRPGDPTPLWERLFESAQPLTGLQADLRGFADGNYRIDVLDAALAPLAALGMDFYLSNRAMAEKWFGVIEIGAGAGGLALLDGAGQVRSPRFQLRFLNQASRWRYLFPRTQPVGAGAEVAPDPGDASILVTPAPRPLTYAGQGVRLRADDVSTPAVSERIQLPQPSAEVMRKQNNQWFSETHLSNLPSLS